jgi:hypothetical protein
MPPSAYISLWRDSVAAGDDVDAPHETTIKVEAAATIGDLCILMSTLNYLPTIAGGRATWILNGKSPIAVFAQQWVLPKLVVAGDRPIGDFIHKAGSPQLNLHYWCQVDPELVHRNLSLGLPLPDRHSS